VKPARPSPPAAVPAAVPVAPAPPSSVFLKPKAPPVFTGDAASTSVTTWLKDMELYATAARQELDGHFVLTARTYLAGEARLFLDTVGQLPATWSAFVETLTRRFEPLNNEERARKELRLLTQRKCESLAAYGAKVMALAARIPSHTAADVLDDYLHGLDDYLQLELGKMRVGPNKQVFTLEVAMRTAEELHSLRQDMNRNRNFRFQNRRFRSSHSSASGHGTASQPTSAPVAAASDDMELGAMNASSGAHKKGGFKGKKGSTPSKKKDVECHYCGRVGHYQRECRDKMADESSSASSRAATPSLLLKGKGSL